MLRLPPTHPSIIYCCVSTSPFPFPIPSFLVLFMYIYDIEPIMHFSYCPFLPNMASSSCLQLSFKVDSSIIAGCSVARNQQFCLLFKSGFDGGWSSIKGCTSSRRKHAKSAIRGSWVSTSEIASSAFTLGTVAVLPFYTLMIVAPKAKLTKRSMDSSMPYMVLGLVYVLLLYLSWTPGTVQAMFASKYLLPELPGMAKLFSNEMTLASAWIHLLGIDLFAARQIFHDGLENGIETRHSVSLCLLSCPVGILSHFITKALTKTM